MALPSTGVEPFRSILRESGAHVYARGGEVVYAGGGLLSMHSKESGPHTVTLRSGRAVSFTFGEGGGTAILDSQTGELLLSNP